jgi:hypothetical protein
MAKILLVEKRYDGSEENPSVTAQWIEIPDGEEDLFLEHHLRNMTCVSILKNDKNEVLNEKTADTRFADAIVKLSTPISIIIVIAITLFMCLNQNR